MRGSQVNCEFRSGHKSLYRFGIRSCLATSHKQIPKTPFDMTSSCTLGFQATRPATWAHFIQQQQQQHKLYLHDYNYIVTVLQKL